MHIYNIPPICVEGGIIGGDVVFLDDVRGYMLAQISAVQAANGCCGCPRVDAELERLAKYWENPRAHSNA